MMTRMNHDPIPDTTPDRPAFVIIWDPGVVSPEDYARLVTAIGDLVRAAGGLGIERVDPPGQSGEEHAVSST
jgi:hypothetical protein